MEAVAITPALAPKLAAAPVVSAHDLTRQYGEARRPSTPFAASRSASRTAS